MKDEDRSKEQLINELVVLRRRIAELETSETAHKRAVEALRGSEARYRELVQNANSIILRMDAQGHITFFNEFAQSFFGYAEDEILGQNVVGTIVPRTESSGRDLAAMIENVRQRPERYTSNENENIRRNGERVWVAWTNKATFDDEGHIAEILCIGNDITERKQAEEALRHYAQRLEAMLEVSRNVVSTLELEPLLGLILDQLKAVVDYSGATIFALGEEDLTVLAYRGPIPPKAVLQWRFSLERARANREVIRRREPVIISDVRDDTPLARAFQELAGEQLETTFSYIRSWMGVPLLAKERVIGMLTLDHSEPNYYSPWYAELALAFANHAAVAIENARLFAQAEQRMRELEALYRAEEELNRAEEELYRHLHLDQVLQTLVDVAVDLLQADKSSLVVWDAQRARLVVRAAHGFSPETMAKSFALGEGVVGRVAASGEPLVVEDTLTDSRMAGRVTGPEGIRSFMGVPIKIGGQVFGLFNVNYTQPRAFSSDDQRLFLALAQRAALAIENARLYEQAQQVAVLEERQRLARELHDAVTQTLFSASLIAEVLPRLWERSPDEGWRRLEELRQLIRGALAEMRTLLLELRPAALVETGLGDLLRQLAEAITGRARVPVTVKVKGQRPLPSDVQVALYRIAQEALNNVAKHAEASQATVSLRCQPERVELRVSDDGHGFNPENISPEHLGLGIMCERATAIGATLKIESQIGHGTQVVVVWPDAQRKEQL